MALIPTPNLGGVANNYYVNTPISYNLEKLDTKVDWNATSKLRFTGRVGDDFYNEVQATIFGDILGGGNNHIQTGSIFSTATSATYVASPTLVFDATWGLTWEHQLLFPPNYNTKYGSDVLGIPGTNVGQLPWSGGMPNFNVSSYSNYGFIWKNYCALGNCMNLARELEIFKKVEKIWCKSLFFKVRDLVIGEFYVLKVFKGFF